jgi:PadR family transcriptional regulator, regulatory protein PadR
LLLLLKEAPSYGYELLERLPQFGMKKDHASLYRTLRALENEGLVRSGWEERVRGPDRRRYQVTVAGEAWLELWAAALSETQNLLASYLRRYSECGGRRSRLAEPAQVSDPNLAPRPSQMLRG